jgi:hypothetical protein
MTLQQRIDRLRESLREIRDIAQVSEGVDFYAMLADRALTFDEHHTEHDENSG